MTMTGHILRADSLRDDENHDLLNVGAPFFRGIPLSAISGISVAVGESVDDDPKILLGQKWTQVSDLAAQDLGEWFLQDRYLLKLSFKSDPNKEHAVKVKFMISPPQFRTPAGEPVVMPMIATANLKKNQS